MTQMTVFLPLAVIITLAAAADRLGRNRTYTIDKSKISISGISSGAFFAVQFHVAFSRDIMGVGVTAGGPYFCAKGNVTRAITVCMKYPLFINVTELVSITHAMEQNKTIDPVQEMQGDKVLLVSGLLDTVVRQGVMVKLLEWYKNFVDASNISTVFEIPAEHAMLTDDYGNFCAYFGPPYINDCFYSAAYWTLQHIYGDVVPATSFKANSDHLLEFNQSEFFGTAQKLVGMDDTGYLYVPSTCQNKSHACRLHIALHGCLMSRQFTGSTFVEHAGYNQVAEVNDIIVLYPQTHSNRLNPNGCFDWWGYTSPAYASKMGPQMAAVKAMVDRVTG